jgi:hypothetical protein
MISSAPFSERFKRYMISVRFRATEKMFFSTNGNPFSFSHAFTFRQEAQPVLQFVQPPQR